MVMLPVLLIMKRNREFDGIVLGTYNHMIKWFSLSWLFIGLNGERETEAETENGIEIFFFIFFPFFMIGNVWFNF